MRRRIVTCIVASLAVPTGPRPVLAHYDERDAGRDCERAIVDAYGYQEFYGERADETGSDSYDFSGMVRGRGPDQAFSCKIRHREVVSYKLREKAHDKDDGSFNAGTAAAVGAGVLGLAVLAAVAGSSDDDHARKQSAYQSDRDSDPMVDRDYVEEECRSNLLGHLQHDHGSVDRLHLAHAYLDGRDLRGEGDVEFRFGGSREIEFICAFDRQGRIYDGSYRYY